MSELKRTPGPWAVRRSDTGGWKIVPADKTIFKICRIENSVTNIMDFDDEAEGDAHLIAAAPAMLAALEQILAYCGSDTDPAIPRVASAAIAQATGAQS